MNAFTSALDAVAGRSFSVSRQGMASSSRMPPAGVRVALFVGKRPSMPPACVVSRSITWSRDEVLSVVDAPCDRAAYEEAGGEQMYNRTQRSRPARSNLRDVFCQYFVNAVARQDRRAVSRCVCNRTPSLVDRVVGVRLTCTEVVFEWISGALQTCLFWIRILFSGFGLDVQGFGDVLWRVDARIRYERETFSVLIAGRHPAAVKDQ